MSIFGWCLFFLGLWLSNVFYFFLLSCFFFEFVFLLFVSSSFLPFFLASFRPSVLSSSYSCCWLLLFLLLRKPKPAVSRPSHVEYQQHWANVFFQQKKTNLEWVVISDCYHSGHKPTLTNFEKLWKITSFFFLEDGLILCWIRFPNLKGYAIAQYSSRWMSGSRGSLVPPTRSIGSIGNFQVTKVASKNESLRSLSRWRSNMI